MPAIDFAFLADAAQAEPSRKIYVLGGGFDYIGVPSFPVVHPHMALVLRLLVEPSEVGREHSLELRLVDPESHEMTRIEGRFTAHPAPHAGREIPMPLVFNLNNIRFEQGGEHRFEIVINGQHMKSLPLRIEVGRPAPA